MISTSQNIWEGKWLDMDGPLKNNIDPDVILVVDDDSTYAKMLERALRLAGFMCLSAGNATDAIKILKSIKVDVVVSDIVMPVMNGVQFTEIIKNNFDSDVILITGYADEFDFPEIIEMDINPLMVMNRGQGAVAVDSRISVSL